MLKPTIVGRAFNNNERLPENADKELRRQVLNYQRNEAYVKALNIWRERLFSSNAPFYFPAGDSNGAEFKITGRNALAVVHHAAQKPGEPLQRRIDIDHRLKRLVKNKGVRVTEPQLVFSDKKGQSKIYDPNPLRGIAQNRPYDYALTLRHLNDTIRIGVVAPEGEGTLELSQFLDSLQRSSSPGANEDYVLPFPGFNVAFGVPLEIPQPRTAGWATYLIPDDTQNLLSDALRLQRNVTSAIDQMQDRGEFDAIVVHIPKSCEDIMRVDYEGGHFDLRRVIKAFCIEKGIASQILLDKTISGDPKQRCQSAWWLALALYVKANRTPWVLAGHSEDTAFAGLGFSLEQNSTTGKHITIGCSHIYNSRGVDLKYKLSGLENVKWHNRKNPFLSRDDARRVGEGVRELFFEATKKLPRRVVLHKRTPFDEDEKKGLLEGLHGVEAVDLLEVTEEPHLRFMTNTTDNKGQLKGGNFPVSRDTVLQLDARRALLWIHGTMPSVQGNRNYYMGGYGIPAPLSVRRAFGETPLITLAEELLGLSKMNWNTFSPYTKAPATIQSSNDIAQIGSLLKRFGSTSYDYRLFM